MNRKYMDFVPARSVKATTSHPKVVRVVEQRGVAHRVTRSGATISNNVSFTRHTTVSEAPELGVIEDLNRSFVPAEQPKSSINENVKDSQTLKEAKAKKIKARPVEKPVEKSVEKPVQKSTKKTDKKTYGVPKSPFINLDKVNKRPLSKNVYRKKVDATKEISKGPVTIISKPEKDSRISLIITIILTIILGAAAGTVAFLLLPK